MAIESRYWKEELARIALLLRPVSKPRRWTERAVCTVERDLMIGFFMVRRMIELHKISGRLSKSRLKIFSTPATQRVTVMNRYEFFDNYRWSAEKQEQKLITDVCNQCIHSYLSRVERGADRNWCDLYVVSDYDRNKFIWRIPIAAIRDLFISVSRDYPSSSRVSYNQTKGDYESTDY